MAFSEVSCVLFPASAFVVGCLLLLCVFSGAVFWCVDGGVGVVWLGSTAVGWYGVAQRRRGWCERSCIVRRCNDVVVDAFVTLRDCFVICERDVAMSPSLPCSVDVSSVGGIVSICTPLLRLEALGLVDRCFRALDHLRRSD